MASTYSTSLKIQLMGNGEDSGTWGSITNTNWNLIQQAVAGVQSITMTNSNYTLTSLNGVSDEARNMVLVVGGTNSAVYQIVAPLVPKFYVISNQTVGGYAITIGGSSGSIVTVPNGATAQVYCNGTSFFSAQTSSAGNFNVNGNLTVSGTSTFTGAVTASSTLSAAGLLTASAGIAATTGNFSGNLASLGSVSGATGVFGAVSGTTGTFSSTVSGTTITAATQFSGPGTGLTGTASSLTAGAATNATNVISGGTIASNVTATTQSAGDNSTKVATTAYVATAVSGGLATLGTMATQNANAVAITGGTMSGMTSIAGGTISGTTGTFSGAVSGTTGTFSGAVSGTTGTFSSAVSGTTGTFTGALTATAGVFSSNVTAQGIVSGLSPNNGSTGGIQIRDAAGNPDAVYIQGLNNSGSTGYATLKLNANGTVTPSGNIVGSITGNAATATAPASGGSFVTSATKLGLGITGETWHAGVGTANVTYTNSRSYPIMVSICYTTPGGAGYIEVYVGGVLIMQIGASSNTYGYSFIVQAGATYVVGASGSASVTVWSELY